MSVRALQITDASLTLPRNVQAACRTSESLAQGNDAAVRHRATLSTGPSPTCYSRARDPGDECVEIIALKDGKAIMARKGIEPRYNFVLVLWGNGSFSQDFADGRHVDGHRKPDGSLQVTSSGPNPHSNYTYEFSAESKIDKIKYADCRELSVEIDARGNVKAIDGDETINWDETIECGKLYSDRTTASNTDSDPDSNTRANIDTIYLGANACPDNSLRTRSMQTASEAVRSLLDLTEAETAASSAQMTLIEQRLHAMQEQMLQPSLL